MGDLEKCRALAPEHEAELVAGMERERENTLAHIDAAYAPFLAPLVDLRKELQEREEFAAREAPGGKEEKKKFREEKKANTERLKDVRRELKALDKLVAEAEKKRAAARQQADREIALAREAPTGIRLARRSPSRKVFADEEAIETWKPAYGSIAGLARRVEKYSLMGQGL